MNLVIYGAGGLGREIAELALLINSKEDRWERIFFAVDKEYLPNEKYINELEIKLIDDCIEGKYGELEFALGQGDIGIREKLLNMLNNSNLKPAKMIFPGIIIPKTTSIGDGCIIQEGCFISCNVNIGDFVYIQPKVNIGHDSKIGKNSVVSGMVNIGGHVKIGENTFIGMSSTIKEDIQIGDRSIIGMCSAVFKDVQSEVVALGNPARVISRNNRDNIFKK